jgi:hypothetical protein
MPSSSPISPKLSSWIPRCSGHSFALTLLPRLVAAFGCSWVPRGWLRERSSSPEFSITSVAGNPSRGTRWPRTSRWQRGGRCRSVMSRDPRWLNETGKHGDLPPCHHRRTPGADRRLVRALPMESVDTPAVHRSPDRTVAVKACAGASASSASGSADTHGQQARPS